MGTTIVVTSPGGLPNGITAENIITHPSKPRNRLLTHILAKLRIAEREGIGVDRIVASMLKSGHGLPNIEDTASASVRVSLVGDQPDREWLDVLEKLEPTDQSSDLDNLLLLHSISMNGWTDAQLASNIIQKSVPETRAALRRLFATKLDDQSTIVKVKGVPDEHEAAWRLSDAARSILCSSTQRLTVSSNRENLALSWAKARGRISSTELSDLGKTHANHAGKTLKSLENQGRLRPAMTGGGGRGYHYLPTEV